MTSGRVLATHEARSAVQRLKTILNGDLRSTITDLERQGDILGDPNQWDGTLAGKFRSSWQTDKRTIKQMQHDLNQLQHTIDQITQNIMSAGGNA
jgi:uncharacterized protein YukE